MKATLCIDNDTLRRLWLDTNDIGGEAPAVHAQAVADSGPGEAARGKGPLDTATRIVDRLGMVQLDPLRPVARAHEHILWTRANSIRPRTFERLLETHRVFEHFSHDACILPIDTWPYWQRQFARRARTMERGSWGCALPSLAIRRKILARIEREGALCSRDFETSTVGSRTAWTKPPHKIALDWLWMSGRLAVAHRRGFIKHYDLTERIVPDSIRDFEISDRAQCDWLCRQALAKLGTATPGELQRFWDAMSASEIQTWIEEHKSDHIDVKIECADGQYTHGLAPIDIEDRLARVRKSGPRLRIINPFDPLVRDRARISRLFGFDYRIEIYVPRAKRLYGYYTFPLLEDNRFIGRIDVRANRDADRLDVDGLWSERGVRFGRGRTERLRRELARFARLGGVSEVAALPEVRQPVKA